MRHLVSIGCALAALIVLPGQGRAQAAEPGGGLAAMEDLRVSAELARAGARRGDPWLLAAAARMRRTVPFTPVGRAPDGGEAQPLIDPATEWVATARRLGRYDRALNTFLNELERGVWRGRAGGPKVSMAVISPDGAHRYTEHFAASSAAAVYVEGDGDTDLVLRVVAEDGAPACESAGPGDVKVCSWRPSRAGAHTIQILNTGKVANSYALATN